MTPPLAPPRHRWAIVIYSLASAVGQNFIYYTITQVRVRVRVRVRLRLRVRLGQVRCPYC